MLSVALNKFSCIIPLTIWRHFNFFPNGNLQKETIQRCTVQKKEQINQPFLKIVSFPKKINHMKFPNKFAYNFSQDSVLLLQKLTIDVVEENV